MNRQPIQHEQSNLLRVISAPNGLWQAQERAEQETKDLRHSSGWRDIGRATTRELALRHIYTKQPLRA